MKKKVDGRLVVKPVLPAPNIQKFDSALKEMLSPEFVEIYQHNSGIKIRAFGRKFHSLRHNGRVVAGGQRFGVTNCGEDFARQQFKIKELGQITQYQNVAVEIDQPGYIQQMWQQDAAISHERLAWPECRLAKDRWIYCHKLQPHEFAKPVSQSRKSISRPLRQPAIEHFHIYFPCWVQVA